MKALFFLPHSRRAAGCRYRVHQYIPYLERAGIECDVRELVDESLYQILYRSGHRTRKGASFLARSVLRLRDLMQARRHELLFIYRECYPFGPALAESYLRTLGLPIVYDFDDAIYLPDSERSNSLLRFPEKTNKIVSMADRVIVSNEHLRGYCAAFSDRVDVIPTSVDTDYLRPAKSPRDSRRPLRIGWIGSHSTAKYLDEIRRPLARVAAEFPLELLIVGAGRSFELPGVTVINKDWALDEEVHDFQSIDIGVYPLKATPWELGKAGFKTIQYMAVGKAAVVARVGVNSSIVQDGVNGYLASDEDEWVAKLSQLAANPALRERMGAAGRETVVDAYSLQGNAPRMLDSFRAACRSAPRLSAGAEAFLQG
jgi:glycosyltransferase involved in cell wall biosynthesis